MTIQNRGSSVVQAGASEGKGPGYPNESYLSQVGEWKKNRAIVQGQSYTKDYDRVPNIYTNLLLPFSTSMTHEQYDLYKAEAELPGISSQYVKMLIGGLLRKLPTIELPDSIPQEQRLEIKNWLLNNFGSNNESMISFIDSVLYEELQTSRAWIQIDYPNIDLNSLTPEQRANVNPFPILWGAESVINWDTISDPLTGETKLGRLIVRYFSSRYTEASPYHPQYLDTVDVHAINAEGSYVIYTYTTDGNNTSTPVFIDGHISPEFSEESNKWALVNTNENLFINGKRANIIPFYPANGSIDIVDPLITPVVHREIALYNKMSRRNHLSYLSATYTPVVKSDTLTEADKTALAKQGLGTWMFVGKEDSIETLATPTAQLADMDREIKDAYEEITRIGIKMLSLEPQNSDSSGIAIQIRNASQSATISTLNAKLSENLKKIITFMINWKYDLKLTDSDIRFQLSSDFSPQNKGPEVLRLLTEWYQSGIIPRDVFIEIAKQSDVIPADYDDVLGRETISQDENIVSPRQQFESEMNSITNPVNTTTENN